MIAEQLKKDIEEFYQVTLRQNPLFKKIMNGTVSMQEVSRFVTDVHYLISHTPIFLKLAEEIARNQRKSRLAAFFEEKRLEEEGHDQWAVSDLELLRKNYKISAHGVSEAMKTFVSHLEGIIRQNADNYVPYIFFAEYFTVIATPPAVDALKKNLQIDPKMLTVFTNHAELDKHHVAQGMREINSIYNSESELKAFQKVLQGIFLMYGRVGEEICGKRNKAA